MVDTRGKKKTGCYSKSLEENEAAKKALTERETSDSLITKVEEPKVDTQVEDKVEKTVEGEGNEETYCKEERAKSTKVGHNDQNTITTEANDDDMAELGPNTSEDDDIDDQDVMWEDDGETSEDSEENVVGEDEVSDEEEIEEQDDDKDEVSKEEGIGEEDDDFELSEEEAMEEKGYQENMQERNEIAKVDGRDAEEHNTEKRKVRLKKIERSSERNRKKVQAQRLKKPDSRNKPESLSKRKAKKKVESMGMIFMCSSMTKNDCYKYRVLGLPESKKDLVEKIYSGMRLFLYDVDLKLLYGIYKAAGPGGYNIEPKAFKSQFPSQVRFTILEDCLPLAEEKFKMAIKDNYFTKSKFDCRLNSEQVKKLCKLFVASSKGNQPTKFGRSRRAEKIPRVHSERTQRLRTGDKRHLALKGKLQYHEPRCKRSRKVISPVVQLHRPLPAPHPSSVPSYAYERSSDVDALRRDPYFENHSSRRDRRGLVFSLRESYRDGKDQPTEGHDYYRDGRNTYLERHSPYRFNLDYIEHRDTYRYGGDPYPEYRGPYKDGRVMYLEHRDPYRDERDPYIKHRDSYRDEPDSYLVRRGPYADEALPEPYSSAYKRVPLSDRHDVYREDRRVESIDSYRRGLSERLDRPSLSLESRRRHDIGGRDSYVAYQEGPSYTGPAYSAEYRSRAGLAREYRL